MAKVKDYSDGEKNRIKDFYDEAKLLDKASIDEIEIDEIALLSSLEDKYKNGTYNEFMLKAYRLMGKNLFGQAYFNDDYEMETGWQQYQRLYILFR